MLTPQQQYDAYVKEFGPKTHHEHFLIQMLAHSRWKLERIQAIEFQLVDLVLTGMADAEQSQRLTLLQKYSAAAERSYYKALREFQAARKAAAKPAANPVDTLLEVLTKDPALTHELKADPAAPKTVNAPRRL